MKKYWVLFLGVIFLWTCRNSNKNSSELQQIVTSINKKCPQMLDSETRFDGMEFKEPNTLVYKYSLINLNAQSVDTATFRKTMWPGLLSTVKASSEMQKLRDNETTLEYLYSDKANKLVYRFIISPGYYR
jgi:hypothetical protein